MMVRLDTVLMRAGIRNSSNDCKIPTKEKATPVKMAVGNITRVREADSAAVSASYPAAKRVTSWGAKTMPSTQSMLVRAVIRVIKLAENWKADFLPCLVRYSLNTGIKQAAMAEANTASKKTRGMRLAV